MHPKTVCKTCLNLEAIVDEFGSHFGSLFRFVLGQPAKTFASEAVLVLDCGSGLLRRVPKPDFWRFWVGL